MTGEIPTLVLTVDLDCHICRKKIRKAICKLQEQEPIQTTAYDEKENKVMISGPFDPIKLKKKLCCMACKVIKNITILQKTETEPPVDNGKSNSTKSETKKPEPVYLPFWPVGLPVCCYRPYYVWFNDICRCGTCGCSRAVGPPAQPVVCNPVTYQFSCDCQEAPPPCTIM